MAPMPIRSGWADAEILRNKKRLSCNDGIAGMMRAHTTPDWCADTSSGSGPAQTVPLPEPRQVRATRHGVSLTLHAENENGRIAFAFDHASVAPVIRFPERSHIGLDSSHRRW